MNRPAFDFAVAGSCTYVSGNNSPINSLVEMARFSESSAGSTGRKPQGFMPPTSYSFLKRSYTNAQGSCKRTWKALPGGFLDYSFSGTVGHANGVNGRFISREHFDSCLLEEDPVTDNRVSNQALIKARNAVKGEGINLGVAFAERNATARLVGDTATNLARSYRYLRRGEIRNAMDALGISSRRREPIGSNAPQRWLELQYGWKPLLSDVRGACKRLADRDMRDWRVTVKTRARDVKTVFYKRDGYDAFSMQARRVASAFVRIDAFPRNEALISFQSLGITNPLLIGWELVPYSFVVDWFYPVGSYLESLDALLGFGDVYSSTSLLVRAEWDGVGRNFEDSDFKYENSFSENKRLVKLTRTAQTGAPLPRLPSLKDPRSLGHMANGLSLLATAFGRR